MSCSPFDLRDYFLQELAASEKSQVEAHVRTCSPCREEVERLRLTGAALFSLRDEEIPQRIAFVSDPVFEPSPWRRAWTAFWGSSGRLAFAGAAMLSAALVFSTLHVGTAPATAPAPVPLAAVQTVSDSDMQVRIDQAVARAVVESEARHAEKANQLVSELKQARQSLLLAADAYDMEQKRINASRVAYYASNSHVENGEPR